MSSSLENVIVNSGPLTHLRFNGKNFNLWKMKMIAYMESLELHEVVETPIAETEEEIKLLLSNRVKGDNDVSQSSASSSSSPSLSVNAESSNENKVVLTKKNKES